MSHFRNARRNRTRARVPQRYLASLYHSEDGIRVLDIRALKFVALLCVIVATTILLKYPISKVPPRLELGSPDSESGVLTITPWNHNELQIFPVLIPKD